MICMGLCSGSSHRYKFVIQTSTKKKKTNAKSEISLFHFFSSSSCRIATGSIITPVITGINIPTGRMLNVSAPARPNQNASLIFQVSLNNMKNLNEKIKNTISIMSFEL